MKNRHRLSVRSGRRLLAVAMSCMLLTPASCAMAPHHANNAPHSVAPGDDLACQQTSIGRILADAATYTGRTVILEGRFRGWQGPCPASAALTRSDWVLDDGTGCIYVSGRLPATLSAAAPRGERVRVTGEVATVTLGKLNLRATAVHLVTEKPQATP